MPIGATVSIGVVGAGLAIACFILTLKAVAPRRYKKLTKRCRKPLKELTEDSGRGAVADQLRAILADHGFAGSPENLFSKWDKDGGGLVSRKEFRAWWTTIGYDPPMEDLDDLFAEFDADGPGEIDEDEFTSAFNKKGQLWKELADLQHKHDESAAIHRAIIELKAKIGRKQRRAAQERSTQRRIAEKMALRKPAVLTLEWEMMSLTSKLKEHQARFDAMQGGFKAAMQATRAVNAFKAAMTPDDAAITIQSKVRGRAAAKLVQKKRASQEGRPSSAASSVVSNAVSNVYSGAMYGLRSLRNATGLEGAGPSTGLLRPARQAPRAGLHAMRTDTAARPKWQGITPQVMPHPSQSMSIQAQRPNQAAALSEDMKKLKQEIARKEAAQHLNSLGRVQE